MSQSQSQETGNLDSSTNNDNHAPITPESLSKTLKDKLGAIHADIVDMSGMPLKVVFIFYPQTISTKTPPLLFSIPLPMTVPTTTQVNPATALQTHDS